MITNKQFEGLLTGGEPIEGLSSGEEPDKFSNHMAWVRAEVRKEVRAVMSEQENFSHPEPIPPPKIDPRSSLDRPLPAALADKLPAGIPRETPYSQMGHVVQRKLVEQKVDPRRIEEHHAIADRIKRTNHDLAVREKNGATKYKADMAWFTENCGGNGGQFKSEDGSYFSHDELLTEAGKSPGDVRHNLARELMLGDKDVDYNSALTRIDAKNPQLAAIAQAEAMGYQGALNQHPAAHCRRPEVIQQQAEDALDGEMFSRTGRITTG